MKNIFFEYLRKLEKEISNLPKYKTEFNLEITKEKTKLKSFGVIYSEVNKIKFKNFFSEFLKTEKSDLKKKSNNFKLLKKFELLEFFWQNSVYLEVLVWILKQISKFPIEFLQNKKFHLENFQEKVDNWVLSDMLSSIFSKILEFEYQNFDEKIFENKNSFFHILENWNKSNSPWKIRQSLVSLLYYSESRKKFLSYEILISFVLPHLNFSHYYLQKGIGWIIREIFNLYPKETFLFLQNFAKEISSTAWFASTEKLSTSQKSLLMKIRKS